MNFKERPPKSVYYQLRRLKSMIYVEYASLGRQSFSAVVVEHYR